jgi:tetratricopeptide (TPR) repeat protein
MRRKKVWLTGLIAGLFLAVWFASQQETVQAHVGIWRCQANAADHYNKNVAHLQNAPTYSETMTSARWQCRANTWSHFALSGEPTEPRLRFANEAITAYTELIETLAQDPYRLSRAELLTYVGEETAALADYDYLVDQNDHYWAREQRATLHAQMGNTEAARADFEYLLAHTKREPINNSPAYIARVEGKLASLD